MENKTIICPVDFTEISSNALDYASIFAQKMQGDLVLLHIIGKDTSVAADSVGSPYAIPGSYDRVINNKLETLRNDLEQKTELV